MNTTAAGTAETRREQRRSVERLLSPLNALAERSPRLISRSLGQFDNAGQSYSLPRYVYLGEKGGGETIRLGLLATIRGDEPEGALALNRFVGLLEGNPEIAKCDLLDELIPVAG